jgi:hypothetical protein
MKKSNSEKEITIRGIITPREWNENESVKSVSIESEDEQEYIVENSDENKELLRFLRMMIYATGTCREEKNGKKYFKMKKYWLTTPPSMI